MDRAEWQLLPGTLRVSHMARIYGYTEGTVRKYAQTGNPKLPAPSVRQQFGWNKADVQRHYQSRTAY